MIPFFPPDLFSADRAVLDDLVRQVGMAPEQRFILGPYTARLEQELRESLGAADVVACGSGTGGLALILRAIGVGQGDEVVVPAFGCAPLASTVVDLGATPVFADIDPWTMVLDPAEAERLITPLTKALMPAHLFSVMADMPTLTRIATQNGIHVVEDSAVAQGGVLRCRPAGLWGDAGVYSFVQVKTFGTAGEGGVVVTRDATIGAAVRMLRNHGQDGVTRFHHHQIGYNSRFDEVQAVFQLHRLASLPRRLARRAEIGRYYTQRFGTLRDNGIHPPPTGDDGRCFYVYCLLVDAREALRDHLRAQGIETHVYYPAPLPAHPAFARFAPPGQDWPHATAASKRILALPLYPQLSDTAVEHIADTVCAFARATGPASATQPVSVTRPANATGPASAMGPVRR